MASERSRKLGWTGWGAWECEGELGVSLLKAGRGRQAPGLTLLPARPFPTSGQVHPEPPFSDSFW